MTVHHAIPRRPKMPTRAPRNRTIRERRRAIETGLIHTHERRGAALKRRFVRMHGQNRRQEGANRRKNDARRSAEALSNAVHRL